MAADPQAITVRLLRLAGELDADSGVFVLALADALACVAARLDLAEGALACPLDDRLDSFTARVRAQYRRQLDRMARGPAARRG